MRRPALPAALAAVAVALALALAAPARAQGYTSFHTPSGNIHCIGLPDESGGLVDCEIIEMDGGPLLARPADCDLDWGHRFLVAGRGAAGMACYGDTVRDPAGAVLPYGSSLQVGGVTCTSRRTGLECVNAIGHGFALARAGQRLF